MDSLLQDLRYAVRTLVKNPGFSTLAVLCLAAGVGVNSTVFSIVDAILIRPFPFKQPESIVALHTTRKANGIDRGGVSYLDFRDWTERTHAFTDISAFTGQTFIVSEGGESERVVGAPLTWNLFSLLGVQPVLGRQFREEEDRPGGQHVVILSDALWKRRYAGEPGVVGRTTTIDGNSYTVIGVMPPRFQFPDTVQLWIPLTPTAHTALRRQRNLSVFARLKAGASMDHARADLSAVTAQLAAEQIDDKDWGGSVWTMRAEFVDSELRLILGTMMGAVTLVLLIACVNVANLLLARATVRQREIAVRAALGAGRARIVRQLLTESVLIGLMSAPLGVVLSYVGIKWFNSAFPPDVQAPYFMDWSINPRIILYTGVVAALTGLVFGLVPALHAARTSLQEALKDAARGAAGSLRHGRVRSALVAGELALALVLLVGASMFVRSFLNLSEARAGLDTRAWMLLRFNMSGPQYSAPDAMTRRADDMVHRVEALPGVLSATVSNMLPFFGGAYSEQVRAEGSTVEEENAAPILYFVATPHVFRTLGVPLLSGRDFTDADGSLESDAAVVNQVFAKRFWPNETNVIGRHFHLVSDKPGQSFRVVGVTGDFRLFTVRTGRPPAYAWVSYPHRPAANSGLTIRVGSVAPATITAAVRDQFRQADPSLTLFNVITGEQARMNTFWSDRLFGWMFSIFGGIALLLASVGVYGVLSYSVAQRTQEIGVRMALGAGRRNIFKLIVGYGTRLAAIGVAVGTAGAFGVTHVIKSLLYNVGPNDPFSFIAGVVFLVMVALVASYVPARRATGVDPLVALRAE
jgi:putative ABC transport system permease protein